MDTNDLRRQLLANKYKWALGFLGLAAIGPIAILAAQGVIGIIGVIVGLGVIQGLIQMAPVYSMKLANWRMKLIVGEAQKNPIETQRNVYIEKAKEIAEADQRIAAFDAGIANFHDKRLGFQKKGYADTPEGARYEEIENKMRRGLVNREKMQKAAKLALAELDAEIKKAEAIWDMALEVAGLQALSADAEKKVWQDIKLQVSFDAVNKKLNTAVAQLNLEISNQEDYNITELPVPAEPKVVDIRQGVRQ